MGEFEVLDTSEPLAQRMERHAYDRLIMLSDGVFAIAITLAALEIHVPDPVNGDVFALLHKLT
ncbi:TMEM175 family protein, partial [Acinetobacter baumannii]